MGTQDPLGLQVDKMGWGLARAPRQVETVRSLRICPLVALADCAWAVSECGSLHEHLALKMSHLPCLLRIWARVTHRNRPLMFQTST